MTGPDYPLLTVPGFELYQLAQLATFVADALARHRRAAEAGARSARRAAAARDVHAGRLALARAILLDPAILILDDPTAAVDAGTEHEILEAMDGLTVTIRLIDPPLHEFLPDLTTLAVRKALAEDKGTTDAEIDLLFTAVHRMHEANPMLGLRGVRLGLVIPGLFDLQVRAIAEATAQLIKMGRDPQPEIMIPLVGSVQELEIIRADSVKVLAEVAEQTGIDFSAMIGTMIELPRAAMTAGQIAEAAEFFSFGTNDLTQTTWGFSRDDVEAAFFSTYLEMGIFGVSPFETLDVEGVGELVRIGTERGRATRPDLKVGVCGEHGGDPESVHFFHRVGLDYVSCSPFRIPVARLEAGRVALEGGAADSR